MKLKTALFLFILISGIILLNLGNPLLLELGKGFMLISIVGFFAISSNQYLDVEDPLKDGMNNMDQSRLENSQISNTHKKAA